MKINNTIRINILPVAEFSEVPDSFLSSMFPLTLVSENERKNKKSISVLIIGY